MTLAVQGARGAVPAANAFPALFINRHTRDHKSNDGGEDHGDDYRPDVAAEPREHQSHTFEALRFAVRFDSLVVSFVASLYGRTSIKIITARTMIEAMKPIILPLPVNIVPN